MNIYSTLADEKIKQPIIRAMAAHYGNGNQPIKSCRLLCKEVLGADFDPKKHGKNAQAALLSIVKSGLFYPAEKRGYYYYQPDLIRKKIIELEELI